MNLLKLSIIYVMVFITSAAAVAQSSQIATLFHGGQITNFTSGTALADALADAEDGDVISLSSGLFQAADITKNVTIRGAGMGYPELGGTGAPTILTGSFNIICPESETHSLTLEGLCHNETVDLDNSTNMTILKCQFNKIAPYRGHTKAWNNLRFIHCIINEFSYWPSKVSVQFVNSIISENFQCEYKSDCSYQFDNCVVYNVGDIVRSSMTNSIVILSKVPSAYGGPDISRSSSLNNCIIAGCVKYEATDGNNKFCNASEIFTSEGLYNLSDAMKEFKGTDGTEVGIHGGALPFSPVATNLKISKFKVAERTTADGKLPVEIEIESL